MTALLIVAVAVLAWQLRETRRRLARLEQLLSGPPAAARPSSAAEARLQPEPAAAAKLAPQRDDPVAGPGPPLAAAAEVPDVRFSQRFEALVGKRLPIWIGGIALAFAGFFLVRYSIELGLFGPRARSLLAALFGIVLLVLAEAGPRLPRVGRSFAADPRLAQSLAGAGVATLYGTLYMAAELYALIGLGVAFALVVAVTVMAMVLAQRHGPPTAVLGLAGGYLAPYVAGLPDATLALTLTYLAVFTTGLLALALHRGWAWLAWGASAASLVWTVSLLVIAEPGERAAVGLLVLLAAVGASWVLLRGGPGPLRLPPVLPFAAGIVQLAALAALAEFTPLAWALYLAISAAGIVLARRQPRMMPGVWASLALATIIVGASLDDYDPALPELLPPLSFAVLFGGAGQAFAFRPPLGRQWAWLGATAPGLLLAMTAAWAVSLGPEWAWGLASLGAALLAGAIAVRADRLDEAASAEVATAGVLGAAVGAIGFLLPGQLYPLALAGLAIALGRWRAGHGGLRRDIGLAALGLTALAMLVPAWGLAETVTLSLGGARLHYARIAPLGELVWALALPGLALVAAQSRGIRFGGPVPAAAILAGVALGGFAYALAKQPLAIDAMPEFVRAGFAERALLTQALAAAGWWALRGAGWRSGRFAAGAALTALALVRFAWFDLVLLNPAIVRQELPGWPILNLGVAHAAAMAAWLWLLAARARAWPRGEHAARAIAMLSLATMALAALIAVRQAVHGPIVDQPAITRAETYLYSAGLLLLALAWLGWGIRRSEAVVRLAGLALLTAVTVKVFLIDAAALAGLLRVLSFLGLGAALIGIGWVYGRVGPAPARAPG